MASGKYDWGKAMKKASVLILTGVLCFSMFQFVHFASTTSSAALYLKPSKIEANPLEYFTVALNIDNVTDLHDWQVRLGWDPQILDFVNVTKGDFVNSTSSIQGGMNQTEGWTLMTFQPDPPYVPPLNGVSGSGTLANIVFCGKETGECTLSLNNTKLFDSNPELVATPPNLGDVNNDSLVNIPDVSLVAHAFDSSVGDLRYNPNADFNADGFVDLFDLLCPLLNFFRVYPPYPEPSQAYRPVEIPHIIGVHDIAVDDVTPSKTVVGAGYSVSINTTVNNQVYFPESFNVTLYANETSIAMQNVTLLNGASITLHFTWNTTGFAKGNYTISANAETVPGETNLTDNNLTGGWIFIAMIGDITGPYGYPDGKVDMRDIGVVAQFFGVNFPNPQYNPNCDTNDDGKIDMKDISLVAWHFGQHDP